MPNDSTYIGLKASGFDKSPEFEPYTGVILTATDENGDPVEYSAGIISGPNAGRVLETDFPWATQAMADALLSRVSGFRYQPFSAMEARLDPASELGDAVTVGGVYSVIAKRVSEASSLAASDIEAGNDEEINHEFRYQSPIQRSIKNLGRITAQLRVEAERIEARVESAEGDISSLTLETGRIATEVSGKINGTQAQSLIDQTIDNITLSVSSGSGGSSISLTSKGVTITSQAVDLNVKAANISGQLTIGQLPSTVAEIGDIPTDNAQLANGAGYQTPAGVVSIINGTVSADYVEALGIKTYEIFDITSAMELNLGNAYSGNIQLLYGFAGVYRLADAMWGIDADPVDGNVTEYLFGAPVVLSSALGGNAWRFSVNPNSNELDVHGPIVMDSYTYGSTFPSNPKVGQLFFKVVS